MKLTIDYEVNAAYLKIKEGKVFKTKEISDGINADLDSEGNVLGIELYSLKNVDLSSIETIITKAKVTV